jgi:DNA-binding transcriptional MerR regulator
MNNSMLKELSTVFQSALEEFAKRQLQPKARYTKAEVARRLGTTVYLLNYLVANSKIPDVSHGNSRRKYYDDEDLSAIQKVIASLDTDSLLFSQRKAAPLLGLSARQLELRIKKGLLPAPTHGSTYRMCYTATEVGAMKQALATQRAVAALRQSAVVTPELVPLYGCHRVAKLLGVSAYTLARRREAGLIPAPTRGNSRRKYYSQEDVEVLRKFFSQPYQPERNQPAARAAAAGYLSIVRSAEYLNVPLITLTSWLNKGRLPRPSHVIGGVAYYPTAELDGFRVNQLADYFAKRAAGQTQRGRKGAK